MHLQVQLGLPPEAESVEPQESKWLTARRGRRSRYLLIESLLCQTLLLVGIVEDADQSACTFFRDLNEPSPELTAL